MYIYIYLFTCLLRGCIHTYCVYIYILYILLFTCRVYILLFTCCVYTFITYLSFERSVFIHVVYVTCCICIYCYLPVVCIHSLFTCLLRAVYLYMLYMYILLFTCCVYAFITYLSFKRSVLIHVGEGLAVPYVL